MIVKPTATSNPLGSSYVDRDDRREAFHREVAAATADLMGQEIEFRSPAVADQEFTVYHWLRRTPTSAELLRSESSGKTLYASRIKEWNAKRVFLKYSGADETIRIRLR